MARDSNIPLFLWIATALLAHLAWGGGADRMARVLEDRLDIQRFARAVQTQVRRGNQTVEVALLDEDVRELEADEPEPKPDVKTDSDQNDDETPPDDESAERDKSQKKDDVEPEQPKPEKPPELALKPEEEKKKDEQKKAEQKPVELPQVPVKGRIAVEQHVKDKKQEDNPDAEFIGNDANKVKEQTQARITSTTQNDPNPNPGGNHSSAAQNPGNSDESTVAQDEDKPGEPDRAPDPEPGSQEKVASAQPPPARGGSDKPADRAERAAQSQAPKAGAERGSEQNPPARLPAQAGQKARAAQAEQEAAPNTVNTPNGRFSVAKERAAQQAQKGRVAKKKRLPPPKRSGRASDFLGLGAPGLTQSGVNLNLTPRQAYAAIGKDTLKREKLADSERRRSKHRGSWKSVGIEKWRSAIENYVPSVKPGNQTALNTARVPFAGYLNAVHNRLHPVFADSFLASLSRLPGDHPMNRPDMTTHLEIVLDQDEGRVVRMGITRTSGVTAFDIAALESVQRASPFGMPPREIVSPDGRVYFHWEFYRDPFYACSTYFAHPYMIKGKPKTAPPAVKPPSNGSPARDERHGSLLLYPDGSWLIPVDFAATGGALSAGFALLEPGF